MTTLRSKVFPVQKRWASEEITQSEPEADGATEAQHGENSIAAASENEAPATADREEQSTVTSAIKSAAETASAQASAATTSVSAAAETARDYVSGATQEDTPARTENAESNTVYVGNLFFDVTAEDLRNEFGKAGAVENAKIVYDQRGLSKGQALSNFSVWSKPLIISITQVRLCGF